ncbi:MAG: hypothetical protein SOX46_09210 [Clostridiaceae bacterium]|uniref:Uncharacterized protein n=2 Tax=Clostridium porci TaxID=2605778 RepID=A0A7X2NHV2_9CLOT|nr:MULTISPECIES: hypothetical protein [Clostridium]MCI6139463.1 hypothetical protein [Clostridium sp.]MDY3231732.1 hypothetical protein [Clostridiaceae bacterium]MSS35194.1 hypothetical protein [Clostridium porci]
MLIKKIVSLFLVLLTTLSMTIPSLASIPNTQNTLEVQFNDFKFTTNDYDPAKVTLEYSKKGTQEQVVIKDKAANETLEIMTVQSPAVATRSVVPYIFKRAKSYGATTVELSVHVELYKEGSFRQINALTGSYLGITTNVAPTEIEDKTISVWSQNNTFPTTELMFAYSGTLVASVSSSMSAEVSAELLGSGFSFNSEVDGTSYYRRSIDSTGTISLY